MVNFLSPCLHNSIEFTEDSSVYKYYKALTYLYEVQPIYLTVPPQVLSPAGIEREERMFGR